jgi:8-oxo-dGTP pyrophosphatase MutT (NUDIX family)
VKNEKGEFLLIFRRGKWDLPKGKLDDGETIEECAVREVREETGLKTVTARELVLVTYHTYHQGTHFILKESHWYNMSASSADLLQPQTEEDIEKIIWVAPVDIPAYFPECFPSVVDVLKAGLAE